ncbi:uncharacterized protein [Littorina saxatilis]|uniref:DUF4291 domain-containing protein n=2 Tax=Littorina saxatilis TaxID=31220 RepID=A0AAN9FW70_9CAEN
MATAAECADSVPTDTSSYEYSEGDWEREGEAKVREVVQKTWPQGIEVYKKQKDEWPSSGKHIVASYDDSSIVVYQAFCPAIADSAVKDQKFGGGGFSFTRMSWIKTNFLWMMYRCGWATKHKQERILAVRITLQGFNQILAAALTSELQKTQGLDQCEVRLQWDPDHSPIGGKLTRRAIQLGLKDDILRKYSDEWIVSITDVTPFVRHQHRVLKQKGQFEVSTPHEKVYTTPSESTRQRIGLDPYFSSQAQLVS